MRRGVGLTAAGLLSLACLIPEYRVLEDGSGGTNGDGGSDGSGGGQASGGGSLPSDSGGAASGGTGGSATGGSATGGSGTGGEGGLPPAWSCADEMSNLPSYYSNGTLCGYRFAFRSPSSGDGVPTLSPPCTSSNGSDCFRDGFEYVIGSVPPSAPPIYPAIGIGMSLIQPSVGGGRGEWELEGYGIEVDYLSTGAQNPARIQLRSEGQTYCANALGNVPLAWQDFRFECWDTTNTDTLEPGDVIDELQVSVGSTEAEQTITRLDIVEVTLHETKPPFSSDGHARLFVPFGPGATDVSTEYSIDLGTTYDLSDPTAVVLVRVLVETLGTTGGLQVFFRSGPPNFQSAYFWHQLADMKGRHELVVYPAEGDTTSGYDPSNIATIGIQVTSGTPPSGTLTAETTVYLDAIGFSGNVPLELSDFEFVDDLQGLTMNTSSYVAGSTLEWIPPP